MRKIQFIFFSLLMLSFVASAQENIKLWQAEAIPYSNGTIGDEENLEGGRVSNVQDPSIYVYLPEKDKATGAAVVICPGGGYRLLAINHEGHDIAKWYNEIGIAGIVVKNRLPTSDNITCKSEVAMFDAQRAVRMTRYNAEEWGLDKNKIGIMGFSAGGHLASTVGTHYDYGRKNVTDPIEQESCRPDFMVLMYPVIDMSGDIKHSGSMRNLIGEDASEAQVTRFSNQMQVTADTPPTILIHSVDDSGVPAANSVVFYEALVDKGVPAELHIFNSGKHGYGLGRKDGTSHNYWPKNVEAFILDIALKP